MPRRPSAASELALSTARPFAGGARTGHRWRPTASFPACLPEGHADSEREGHDGRDGEQRLLQKRPQRILEVVHYVHRVIDEVDGDLVQFP